MTNNAKLLAWVKEVETLCQPDAVRWCDGSEDEYAEMIRLMVEGGTARQLDERKRPNSYLILSDPADVARVEDRTYICSAQEEDAGPNNNWCDPSEMKSTLRGLFDGCMKGRTLYVIPFSMGPIGSPIAHIGVQLSDSVFYIGKKIDRINSRARRERLPMTVEDAVKAGLQIKSTRSPFTGYNPADPFGDLIRSHHGSH